MPTTKYTFNFTEFSQVQMHKVCADDEKSARAELLCRFPDARDIVLMQAMTVSR